MIFTVASAGRGRVALFRSVDDELYRNSERSPSRTLRILSSCSFFITVIFSNQYLHLRLHLRATVTATILKLPANSAANIVLHQKQPPSPDTTGTQGGSLVRSILEQSQLLKVFLPSWVSSENLESPRLRH